MFYSVLSRVAAVAVVVLAATVAEAQTPALPMSGTGARPSGGPIAGLKNLQKYRSGQPPVTSAARPAGANAMAGGASAEHPNDGGKVESGGRSIEFNAAPLEMVFKVYGELTEKTVLKDPATPAATITLQPLQGQELTDEDKILAIETVLEMNGVHLEPYGEKFVRAIPRKEVRKDGIPLFMDPDTELKESTKVVSLMLPFRNISIEEAQKALEGFKSGSGVLNVFERTNSILITDTEANINRMREIARSIDITTPVTENVFVRQIRNAAAADIKTALEAIVQESQKELEKNGKQPKNAAATPQTPSPFGNSLLRRPGQNAQQPAAVNNASVVTTVSDADRGMIRGKVLILADERSNKLIIVTSKPNMDFFDKVIEELDIETTPDTVVKVYRLKYADSEDVSDMINDLIGNASSSKSSSKGNQNAASKNATSRGGNMTSGTTAAPRKSANQRTGEAKAGELSKENTTVLSDKRINGLVVMTNKELVPIIESIIESMDIKLSQVLIETVIIEVGLGDDLKTGMDWVQKGRQKVTTTSSRQVENEYGQKMFYVKNNTTGLLTGGVQADGWKGDENYSLSTVPVLENVTSSSVLRNDLENYYTAGTAVGLGGGANNGLSAYNALGGMATNVLGKAFNFVFDSEELGIAGILQASKSDSRTKYIASPIIMTLDNKEATIEATQMRYLFKGYQYSGSAYNGSPVPDYEQKELGITIKVTPKINPNGTVMLTIEEEYSQMGGKQAISGQNGKDINAENTVTRKMSADALLENNQTVIFAGLTETSTAEDETGIPFLKDIPYIGKWLFGSVSKTEARSELLVFMTPYVLDDAASAEAEAIRRKRSISDQHAWDDHGWSASKLADPVSKKEQMRRLKEEAKKQDEERQTQLAIEKWKLERAKKLKALSKEERDLWLKMHKEELEEEEQEELEKKMLDPESQDALQKLAAAIREKSLSEADKEIKAGEEKVKSENERARLDAEKAKGEAEEKKSEAEQTAEPVRAEAAK